MNIQNPTADAALLARVPALQAYIMRIGAVQKNFRKYVVEAQDEVTYNGLRREIATVKINAANVVVCAKEYEPTAAEAAAIKLQLDTLGDDWPTATSASASKVKELQLALGADDEKFFAFRNQHDAHYAFVQQRVYNEEGKKTDLPWTMFSDVQWRNMEPAGLLPLYGLDLLASGKPVMVHEGAKAAKIVQALCSDTTPEGVARLAAHPFGAALAKYAHLGWPGGAPNPHRVDWAPLKNLPMDTTIILACDNDHIGKAAARMISRMLERKLTVLMFDGRFKGGFDLADPFPAALFNEAGKYTGPDFDDFCRSGTWASDTIPNPAGRGAPVHVLTRQFVEENWFVNMPPVYMNTQKPALVMDTETFNRTVGSFSDAANTARLLLRHPEAQAAGVVYDPSKAAGLVTTETSLHINLHSAPVWRMPVAGATRLGSRPFIRFLRNLVPNKKDRRHLMQWIATLVARPDLRMRYGVLMISETQGVGKSTLMEKILAPLLGWHNVSTPSEKDVTESSFNGWIAKKRLVMVHEIYAGHSKKAYNVLKTNMTDDWVLVNEKFQPEYQLRNWAHFIASSNSVRALLLVKEDRRWLVPKITDQKQKTEYWIALNKWLEDEGLLAIWQWAVAHVEKYGAVLAGADAPMTDAKQEVIASGYSDGMNLILDLAGAAVHEAEVKEWPIAMTDRAVREWLAGRLGVGKDYQHLESPLTVRRMLKAGGMQEVQVKKIKGLLTYVFCTCDDPAVDADGNCILKPPADVEEM